MNEWFGRGKPSTQDWIDIHEAERSQWYANKAAEMDADRFVREYPVDDLGPLVVPPDMFKGISELLANKKPGSSPG